MLSWASCQTDGSDDRQFPLRLILFFFLFSYSLHLCPPLCLIAPLCLASLLSSASLFSMTFSSSLSLSLSSLLFSSLLFSSLLFSSLLLLLYGSVFNGPVPCSLVCAFVFDNCTCEGLAGEHGDGIVDNAQLPTGETWHQITKRFRRFLKESVRSVQERQAALISRSQRRRRTVTEQVYTRWSRVPLPAFLEKAQLQTPTVHEGTED